MENGATKAANTSERTFLLFSFLHGMLIRAFLERGGGCKQNYSCSFWLRDSRQRKAKKISEHVSVQFKDSLSFFAATFHIICLSKVHLDMQHNQPCSPETCVVRGRAGGHAFRDVCLHPHEGGGCLLQALLQGFCFSSGNLVLLCFGA